MPDDVDPYFVLLGLPPGERPPNHYVLLGIDAATSDVARIGEIAEQRTAQVAKFLTGPHAAAAQRLIGEIATAKVVLTTPAARAEYDRRLAADKPSNRAKPTPKSAKRPVPAAAPSSGALPPLPPKAVAPQSQTAPKRESPQHKTASSKTNGRQPDTAPVIAVETPRPRLVSGPKQQPAAASPTPAFSVEVRDPPRRTRGRRRGRRLSWMQIASLGCLVASAILGVGIVVKWQQHANADSSTARVDPSERRRPTDRVTPPQPPLQVDDPTDGDNQPSPPPTDNGRAPDNMNANDAPPPAMTDDPAPTPPAVDDPPPPPPDAALTSPAMDDARTRDVAIALAAVREALAGRDVAAATEQLDLATVAAAGPLLEQCNDLRVAVDYMEKFRGAVDTGLGAFEAGEEIQLGDQPTAIVESTAGRLVIRAAGRNAAYDADSAPVDLAILAAHRALTDNLAEQQACDGVFLMVDAAGDPQRGRALLKTAADAGLVDAERILRALQPQP